jgi:predicted dinucleotide-binding enzyme
MYEKNCNNRPRFNRSIYLEKPSNKGFYLIAISSNPETLKKIEAQSLAQRFSSSLKDTADADVVFVCSPISVVVGVLKELEAIVFPNNDSDRCCKREGVYLRRSSKTQFEFIRVSSDGRH